MHSSAHAVSSAGVPDSVSAITTPASRRNVAPTVRVYPPALTAPARRSRSALAITDTELNVMAALAIIGLSSSPNAG